MWYHLHFVMSDFENAIADLDLGLFSKIESQSTPEDKRSFLAVQNAVRRLHGPFNYLEIGSYLGGSIQPYLLDPDCEHIYSIDKRPKKQPDARGFDYTYLNNSTARMIENLEKVSKDGIKKITTIDGDTGEVDPALVDRPIQICFIDGEHTDEAVVRDFEFCRQVLDVTGGVIVFHDSQITYNGIATCVETLKAEGVRFRAYNIPHIVFVIEVGEFPIHTDEYISELLVRNHEGYLFSLQDNDRFRQFANKTPFRIARGLLAKIKGGNVSK